MVGVGVRVDDVMEAQPRPGGEREVAIDLAQLRVDEHRTARLGAAHEIGEAAARAHLLEDHRRGDSRASVLALSTAVATTAEEEVVTGDEAQSARGPASGLSIRRSAAFPTSATRGSRGRTASQRDF